MVLWNITYSIVDDLGKCGQLGLFVTSDFLYAIDEQRSDPYEFAQQMAAYLDNIIAGKIARISLQTNVTPPGGIKTTPDTNSRVERGAMFVYSTQDGFIFRHRVPTFKENLIIGENVDLTDGDVSVFVEMMTLPEEFSANWNIGPGDNRGNDLKFLVSATEAHVQERKNK